MQRKEKKFVNGPLNGGNVFEWKMEHFIQSLYARSQHGWHYRTAKLLLSGRRTGSELNTVLERLGGETDAGSGQKGLKSIMLPEVSEEQPDWRC
jgi:hypothetical protein